MPDLLAIHSEDWDLVVWSKSILESQKRLNETLIYRKAELKIEGIRFQPALPNIGDRLELAESLFFENKVYEFEFTFADPIRNEQLNACVKHKLRVVEDSFHLTKNYALRGSINFGNNIGWFKLRLQYAKNGKLIEQAIAFQVFATKMDIQTDLSNMLQKIDSTYPLWRYSLSEKTEQELAKSYKPHEKFPLLWLAHFEQLHEGLTLAIKQVVNTPHARLLDFTKRTKAERIRGRIRPRLEEQVAENFASAEFNKPYLVRSKVLSVNTPENRFIKMVLNRSIKTLSAISSAAGENNKAPEQQRLSQTFFDNLNDWKKPLEQYLKRPFFRDIGDFSDVGQESLVLQQKLGYSRVYRIWQQLKMYLDVLGNNASVSMKSIAELYEVWCLLEIRRILMDELGFTELQSRKSQLKDNRLEKSLVGGIGAAFQFGRADGIKIYLAHEPKFWSSNEKAENIRSYTTTQVPDIFIKAEFPSGDSIHWVFDAKYRIDSDEVQDDRAPEDAINQMHRYRDALIHLHKLDESRTYKSRPVLGAYVLYPGFIDEENSENYYQKSIDEVGIGAFPLLPGASNKWLIEFLKSKLLANNSNRPYAIAAAEQLYAEDAARIPFMGMKTGKYMNLTLMGVTALMSSRTAVYNQALEAGKLQFYHIPCSTAERSKIENNVINEIGFCCPVYQCNTAGDRVASHAYVVKSVEKIMRGKITPDQSGSLLVSSRNEEFYWMFTLGQSFRLINPVSATALDFAGKEYLLLTELTSIDRSTKWSELVGRYRDPEIPFAETLN
jgi:uncharacterized protein